MVPIAERLSKSKHNKSEKRRLQKKITYQKYKEKYDQQRKSKLNRNDDSEEKSKVAKRKAVYRLKIKKQKEKFREYMKNYRKKKIENTILNETPVQCFRNRMDKSRLLKKIKKALPKSPTKRAAALYAYIDEKREPFSPAVRTLRKFNSGVENAALNDVKTVIQSVKNQRNDDARSTMKVLTSALSGENIKKKRGIKSLAGILGVKPRTLAGGSKIREKVLDTEKSSWTYTIRKTRSDAIFEDVKNLAYKFWLNPENSRPSCNKNDTKRARIGPKLYSKHMTYVLEKTQTEVYKDFRTANPDIKISQRAFENCKPYFVRPVRKIN